jgi:two-component system LytT family response regulator
MTAIIVDDELHCREVLRIMLEMHCPEVKVLQECEDGFKAIDAIQLHSPDVVFMDIEMPGMNAFDTLQKLDEINFQIIFTTAYDQYAIKAIKFSALDYLLKPIDADELIAAVTKASEEKEKVQQVQLQQLQHSLQNPGNDFKLMIGTNEGPYFIPTDDILFAEGQNNYTHFHLSRQRRLVASKTLLEFENLLSDQGFLRVHKSYLVNLKYVERYLSKNGTLLLTDGIEVEVSRRRKDEVLNSLFNKK